MYKITLSSDELWELKRLERKHQKDWKITRRLRCIRHQNEKLAPSKIKERLEVSADSITDRTKIYIAWWFEALCDLKYIWRRQSAYTKHKEEINQMISENIYNSYLELRDAVEKKLNIGKKKDALYKFCKKKWIPAIKNATSNHETSQT
jgi:hypothetical protein